MRVTEGTNNILVVVDLYDLPVAEKHEMQGQIQIGLESQALNNQQPAHSAILFLNRRENR